MSRSSVGILSGLNAYNVEQNFALTASFAHSLRHANGKNRCKMVHCRRLMPHPGSKLQSLKSELYRVEQANSYISINRYRISFLTSRPTITKQPFFGRLLIELSLIHI